MALILSKFIPVFLLPLGLVLTALAVCVACLWRLDIPRRYIAAAVALCLALLWAAATPLIADRLLTSLEGRYESRPAADYPRADAIVVLGGGVAGQQTGGRNVLPGRAFDRLYLAAALYQAKKAPLVVLSGGGIAWQRKPEAATEARLMADLARQLGLPDTALIQEGLSRNTRENARYTGEILRRRGLTGTVLLVTSAFHLRRAQACFENLGLRVVPCPADFRGDPFKKLSWLDFLPDAGALEKTTFVLREHLGILRDVLNLLT